MKQIWMAGAGGFIGASCRYLITKYIPAIGEGRFPTGTLLVNLAGGFLIGLIMAAATGSRGISDNMRIFLTTGILGGLTTFSTFSYETVRFLERGMYVYGAANILLNLTLSLAGVAAGQWIVR